MVSKHTKQLIGSFLVSAMGIFGIKKISQIILNSISPDAGLPPFVFGNPSNALVGPLTIFPFTRVATVAASISFAQIANTVIIRIAVYVIDLIRPSAMSECPRHAVIIHSMALKRQLHIANAVKIADYAPLVDATAWLFDPYQNARLGIIPDKFAQPINARVVHRYGLKFSNQAVKL